MVTHDVVLVGSYDYSLVALSVLIAILASYATLDFGGSVTSAKGKARLLWLIGGATAMGFGFWSMHYVGMLAFRLPVPVQYDWPTVVLSLLFAILASAVALFVVSRENLGPGRALLGSLLMGGGILAMHYIGMAALRLPAIGVYSATLVTLSVFLAIVISLVALSLTFYLRGEATAWSWKKIVTALVMGAALPVMHYTGVAAASFTLSTMPQHNLAHAVSVSSLSVAGIIIFAAMVLGFVPLTNLRLDSRSDTRQLTVRYFLSLGAISLLAILGTLLVQREGQQSRSDLRVLNIAGRQSMSSQAIAKEALLVALSRDVAERQRLGEDLRSLDALWEQSHSALQHGDALLGLPGTNSPEVLRMFSALEFHYAAMAAATRSLVTKLSMQKAPEELSTDLDSILAHEGPYLQTMNAIVLQYDREASNRDARQSQLYFGLLLAILGVLLLQGLVVLRPALVGIQRSISELVLAKQTLQRKARVVELLQAVAVAANEATSVEAALQFTLDRICEHVGWPVGHVYFRTPKTSAELVSSRLWHLDNASQFESFRLVTERSPLGIGSDMPGRVAESGKPAWIPDINLDNNFPRGKAALELGVRGAFAFPVLAQGEVAAVLEFFSSNIVEPDDELLTVLSRVGAQLGQVVERIRTQEELSRVHEGLKNSMGELASRNREAGTLGEMADLLQSCLVPEEAWRVIGSSAAKLFHGFWGAVFVFSASRNVLEATTTWGRRSDADRVFSPNDCWALRRGHLHHSESAESAVRCAHFGADSRLTSLCTPLMAQGETLGVLCLGTEPSGDAGAPGLISEFNVKLAVAVAEQAALSFANLKLREKLHFQSIRDPLTGLFNRRYLNESLDRELPRAMRKNRSLGLIMLDVDHFKKFNDLVGHDAGDTVLKELGEHIAKFIRHEDMACRYGGEEFTVILPESSLEDTRRRAEELRDAFQQLSLKHGTIALGKVTLSLGVAAFPEHGSTSVDLLAAADAALRRAKQEGRNRVLVAELSPHPVV